MRCFLKTFAISLALAAHSWCAVTVILTCHAEVPHTGDDPSLTTQGQTRARLLSDMLRDTPLDAIFVSDRQRTQQTAQPTAAAHHLRPQKVPDPAGLVSAIRQRTSGTVLIVGHSNTVPQVITMLGGPLFQIDTNEFDNLFILTVDHGQASATRLRYGNPERTSIMQISFVKSGGIGGPMTRVQGNIDLKSSQPAVSGDASYSRTLNSGEAASLESGAEPAALSKAATQIAATQAKRKGFGDVDHYLITVKTSDGKSQEVSLNTSGSADEMQGVNPSTAKFLAWIRQESQDILSAKMKAK